ncbi:MAG: hypothetical protein CMJ18_21900 [Phycisphaeraceae bacterium]|nr:hypothetical protein [Phycisphaeraceae bacterium]
MALRTWAGRFGLLAISIVLCLAFVELVLWWLMPVSLHRIDFERYRLSKNPRITYELRPLAADHNRAGFRDHDRPKTKAPDTFRIAVIGDSIVYGYGVAFDEAYPRRLERMLNDSGRFRKQIEVLNFGVPGYGAVQIVEAFREKGLDFEPDLVIYGHWFDDIANNHDTTEAVELRRADGRLYRHDHLNVIDGGSDHLRDLLLATQIGRRWTVLTDRPRPAKTNDAPVRVELPARHQPLQRLYEDFRRRVENGTHRDVVGSEAYFALYTEPDRFTAWIDALDQWVTTCAESDIPALMLMTPVYAAHDPGQYPWSALHAFVTDVASHFDVPVLDVSERLVDLPSGDIAIDSEHPNGEGCRLIAEGLAAYLVENGPRYGIDPVN